MMAQMVTLMEDNRRFKELLDDQKKSASATQVSAVDREAKRRPSEIPKFDSIEECKQEKLILWKYW